MRMLVAWRNQRACDFDARVAGLNRLLWSGKIPANESVDVRRFFVRGNLREACVFHDGSFLWVGVKVSSRSI